MRVVLHIGTNKTGTSALQGFLNSDPAPIPLQEANLIFPEYGRRFPNPAHHEVAEQIRTSPHRADYIVSHFEEEVANAQADGIFLSSEALHTINPTPLVQTFRNNGHEVEVIAVVRNHIDYFSSWWRETVKSEISTFDFPNFSYLIRKNYAPFVLAWMNAVSEPHFHLYGYRNGSIIPGKNPLPLFDAILQEPRMHKENWNENVSVSGNLLLYKRVINNFITRDISHLIIPELWEISKLEPRFQGSMFVDQNLCQTIDATYAQDAQYIKEYFGIDIFSHNSYREGSRVPNLQTLSDDRDFIIDVSREKGFFLEKLMKNYTGPSVLL